MYVDNIVLIVLGAFFMFTVYLIINIINFQKKTIRSLIEKINEKDVELTELKENIEQYSIARFEKFKQLEINELKTNLELTAFRLAEVELESWKIEYEASIRRDAINRSQAVTMGKVTEHVIPFYENFPYNPKDLRFIGSPIDIIVFDGINDNREVNIVILEIKTGNSSLNSKQKMIKNAVREGRVYWRELNLKQLDVPSILESKDKKVSLNWNLDLTFWQDSKNLEEATKKLNLYNSLKGVVVAWKEEQEAQKHTNQLDFNDWINDLYTMEDFQKEMISQIPAKFFVDAFLCVNKTINDFYQRINA